MKTKSIRPAKYPEFYLVTKKFTSGILKGLTVRERTQIIFRVGRHYTGLCGSSNYVVTGFVPWDEKVAMIAERENRKEEREAVAKGPGK